ncbi:Uncharacterised protein [Vibrio cholerae]|nr:Uncharacterised protein [Vibrio cholerae]CSI92784.1 Uncharacterised protein [Vibrio cholerae]
MVKVFTANRLTVPKSPIVSMATKDKPTAIAGRANGREIRRKLCHGEHFSKRAD